MIHVRCIYNYVAVNNVSVSNYDAPLIFLLTLVSC